MSIYPNIAFLQVLTMFLVGLGAGFFTAQRLLEVFEQGKLARTRAPRHSRRSSES